MKKTGNTFAGSSSRRSTGGRAVSSRAALDKDLDSILGGGGDDDIFGVGSKPTIKQKNQPERPATKATSGKNIKPGSLTSGSTDEDFYSSLAQMAGEGFDDDEEDESFSESDAKKMADSLAGLDDLESNLFGGSLGKNTPSKPSTTVSKSAPQTQDVTKKQVTRKSSTSPEPAAKTDSVSSTLSKGESSRMANLKKESTELVKPGRSTKPLKKFDFGEFDEDDPLAGLGLSDDEEDFASKSKPKKSSSAKKASLPHATTQGVDQTEDRPSTSRGRQPLSQDTTSQSPPVTTESKPNNRGDARIDDRVSTPPQHARPAVSNGDGSASLSSPPGSPVAKVESKGGGATSPAATPQNRKALKPAAKDEINFDSDEDLPGLDEQTPKDSPTPPQRKGLGKGRKQEPAVDLFGDDDNLPDTETRSESPTRKSRFAELMGRKEKDEAKKQVPKSLDDFMANISGGKSDAKDTASKKVSSPISDDAFQFGGYMPSAASTGQSQSRGGLARPDTAPGSTRRSVRFAEDLGLDDDVDIFSNQRPSTAPGERGRRRQTKNENDDNMAVKNSPAQQWKGTQAVDQNVTSKEIPKAQKPKQTQPSNAATYGSKSSGGAGDWLGLDDDDVDDDKGPKVSFTPPKTETPRESKKETSSSQAPPERPERQSSPPRRTGRYRGGGDDNEFLRMLGITPDEPSNDRQEENKRSSLLPWESPGGSPRRGRRWLSPEDQGGPLDGPQGRPHQGAPLADQPDRQAAHGDRPVGSEAQTLTTPSVAQQQTINDAQSEAPSSQERHGSTQPVITSPPPPTQSTLVHPAHPTPPIPPQAYIPQQAIGQPLHPRSVSQPISSAQYQAAASQYPPQTPPYQVQYQPPASAVLYGSPQVPQYSSLEGLEVTKLKAENELQGNKLMEYEVASEQYAQQRTRLEEEVKELVKRIQEVEISRQERDMDTNSKVSELEGKVRRLELEREQLLSTIETLKTRHKEELTTIDTSHKLHLKTLEESYQRREQRLKEETDLIVLQNNEKFKALQAEKADLEGSNSRKIYIVETAKNGEIERLKDLHRRALDQLRQEHEEEMQHLRKLKEREVSAATSAHAHTKSLQSLMDQVLNSTREVSELRQKIEVTHKTGLDEREVSARARDDYLKQLQERLLRQQSENDEERARLQGLVAKMELHIREQTRQVDQERWRLTQEESRLKALQAALEDERRITMEQLTAQRAEVQRARDDLVREQKTTMSQIQEERRNLAAERAQLSSAHRDLINREKIKTESSVQAEADLGATAVKIKEDAAAMAVREAQLKQEEERLRREKHDFERRRSSFDEERERIGKLGLEVQKRSREIDELCADAARVRDEGEQALELAERIRVNAEAQRAEAEGALLVIQEKERQLAQDRLSMAHERRLLEKDKQTGRCWQCQGPRTGATLTMEQANTPDLSPMETSVLTVPSLAISRSGTPDLLVNSLEFKRTLRKWSHDKAKDEEFLEQEAQFLDRLQRLRDNSRHKSPASLDSSSTVY